MRCSFSVLPIWSKGTEQNGDNTYHLLRWSDEALCAVVVKAGALGAACVTADSIVERPAHAVGEVVDSTGAGDALAGGFLGACAAAQRDDLGFFATALHQ